MLTQILDEKEAVIESLVRNDQELKKGVALLDKKSRVAIANKLKELGTQIESEIEKIIGMENDCEKKLLNEKMELFENNEVDEKRAHLIKRIWSFNKDQAKNFGKYLMEKNSYGFFNCTSKQDF